MKHSDQNIWRRKRPERIEFYFYRFLLLYLFQILFLITCIGVLPNSASKQFPSEQVEATQLGRLQWAGGCPMSTKLMHIFQWTILVVHRGVLTDAYEFQMEAPLKCFKFCYKITFAQFETFNENPRKTSNSGVLNQKFYSRSTSVPWQSPVWFKDSVR